jgi:hypothetical protein
MTCEFWHHVLKLWTTEQTMTNVLKVRKNWIHYLSNCSESRVEKKSIIVWKGFFQQ